MAFDLLIADGVDLRPLPLRERKAKLARVGERTEGWIALTNGVVGEGRALYRAVVEGDLEGIVAKRLADTYHPKLTRWLRRVLTERAHCGRKSVKFFGRHE